MSGHVQEDYPLVGGYGENRSKWFYVGAIVFVCWNILLFSLAVAAIAKVVRSTRILGRWVLLCSSCEITSALRSIHICISSLN